MCEQCTKILSSLLLLIEGDQMKRTMFELYSNTTDNSIKIKRKFKFDVSQISFIIKFNKKRKRKKEDELKKKQQIKEDLK
jgi:hypothetical protein